MPKVLVAVDVQKGFVSPSSRHVLKPIEDIQHRFDHVVFTRFYNPDPSPFRRILGYHDLAPGSEGIELAITPRPDAVIIDKPNYSGCNAALERHLARWRAREVHVAGIATEACVMKTVGDLFEQDILTWVIADLCASDKEHRFHDMAISILGTLIGTNHLVNSAEIMPEAA
ncbi:MULTISPECIES: cysteine hydrolase family protein [Asticcacaulis]|uniref:cysteine hydrolase family protein n=1 Tax=Asticcacaulis TaxID=76890 RepID=UPI001AE2466D|nr:MULTISPECIES: isochorismatase family cysteine hydrolase [Asticcacaulis]MBP2159203.1 nicotinamidase-related amidase [Asticcacaulis solisilvae]MDR6800248.1 nicotinamidase-related amidase [Asticcacaulis sp. BE141]